VHAQLSRLLVFAHQRQAPIGREQHLISASLAVTPAVLALLVHIKVMVGMLDDRDPEPALLHQHHQRLDQAGLARARISGKAYDLHLDFNMFLIATNALRESAEHQFYSKKAPVAKPQVLFA
jgi:hypothetical protein